MLRTLLSTADGDVLPTMTRPNRQQSTAAIIDVTLNTTRTVQLHTLIGPWRQEAVANTHNGLHSSNNLIRASTASNTEIEVIANKSHYSLLCPLTRPNIVQPNVDLLGQRTSLTYNRLT
jgi:hypothetical protein